MKNYVIDTSTKQITFLDSRFYLTENDTFVPSVTTIGDAYPKGPEYFTWLKKVGEDADNIRDEAGKRGSIVHDLTERFDNGEEINMLTADGRIGFKLSEWAMFERYVEFRRRFEFMTILNEFTLISEELGFAGTLDRVIELDGRTILVDIKTSNSIYPFYWLQLAAYKKLYEETRSSNKIDDVAILWLNAKTRTEGKKGDIQGLGWQMVFRDRNLHDKDWDMFQATKKLWDVENGEMKPKLLQYKLSHKKQ